MTGWQAGQTMKNLNPWTILLSLALLAAAVGTLPTAVAADSLSWEQLPPREKRVLEPYARKWPDFSLEKQERLRRGARQWSLMTETDRVRARERFKQWRQITPEERQRIRERFEEFRRMPSAERRRLLAARRWFMEQGEERREQLRERWQTEPDSGPGIRLSGR